MKSFLVIQCQCLSVRDEEIECVLVSSAIITLELVFDDDRVAEGIRRITVFLVGRSRLMVDVRSVTVVIVDRDGEFEVSIEYCDDLVDTFFSFDR